MLPGKSLTVLLTPFPPASYLQGSHRPCECELKILSRSPPTPLFPISHYCPEEALLYLQFNHWERRKSLQKGCCFSSVWTSECDVHVQPSWFGSVRVPWVNETTTWKAALTPEPECSTKHFNPSSSWEPDLLMHLVWHTEQLLMCQLQVASMFLVISTSNPARTVSVLPLPAT